MRRLYYWSAKDRAVELRAFDRLLLILAGLHGEQADAYRVQCVLQRLRPTQPGTGLPSDQVWLLRRAWVRLIFAHCFSCPCST